MDLRSVKRVSVLRGRNHPLKTVILFGVIAVPVLVLTLVSLAVAFPDVPAGNPYYAAITDLSDRGIISGYTNGNFGPGDPVTRQQFAKMIVGAGGYPVTEADVCPFADVVVGGPSTFFPDNFVAVCAAKGITVGKTPATFDPYGQITRYQVVSMVVRTADNLQPGLLPFASEGWSGTTAWGNDATHGANAERAEFNGLLDGLDLSSLSPTGPMPRGEVAQVLHNLLLKLGTTPGTTTPTTGGPGPATFTLSVSVPGGHGSITRAPDQSTFNAGATVTLTAVPATGYVFSGWGGDANGTTNPLTVTMSSNKTITATFSPVAATTYTLTIPLMAHGSITRSPNQSVFTAGSTVTLTAVPALGYKFSGWQGDASGTANPLTVTMNSNKTISATFEVALQILGYALTTSVSEGNGSITRNPDQIFYNVGTTVTLTAVPATNWKFSGWGGDASGTTNPLTVTMNTGKTITAKFTPIVYTLSLVAPYGGGELRANPSKTGYAPLEHVMVTAIPESGCVFDGWAGSASGTTNPLEVVMNGNKEIRANFERIYQSRATGLTAGPGVCSTGSGKLEVFWRNADGGISWRYFSGVSWSGEQDLGAGGEVKSGSQPSAAGWSGNILVVARDSSDRLMWRYRDGAHWGNWTHTTITMASDPSACWLFDDAAHVYYVDGSGHLRNLVWNAGTFGTNYDRGGNLKTGSRPDVCANAEDLFVVARGSNDHLMILHWDRVEHRWFSWGDLGGTLYSAPTVTSWGVGRLDVFAIGTGGTLWHKRFSDGDWTSLHEEVAGLTLNSAPDAVSWGNNRIDVFMRGGTGNLWHRWWDGSNWNP